MGQQGSKPRASGARSPAQVLYRARVGGMERRSRRRLTMAQDMLKRQWELLKDRVRQRWSRFTDDDVVQIDGDRETLMSKIQERYGRSPEQAQTDLAQWLAAERGAGYAGFFGRSA
jgi:uncharacterized protein YjbJ (UPF0337 family)